MVGEHIRILRDGRWIHAIDCGDQTVLHLTEEAAPARVRRAYRPEFVAGASAVEIVTHRERTFPATAIVQRAYSRASDPALASMFRDSEAFVEWCTTGRLTAPRNVGPDAGGAAPAVTPASAMPPPRPAASKGARATPARLTKARAKATRPATRAKARPAKAAPRRAARKPARPRRAKGAKGPKRASRPTRKGRR